MRSIAATILAATLAWALGAPLPAQGQHRGDRGNTERPARESRRDPPPAREGHRNALPVPPRPQVGRLPGPPPRPHLLPPPPRVGPRHAIPGPPRGGRIYGYAHPPREHGDREGFRWMPGRRGLEGRWAPYHRPGRYHVWIPGHWRGDLWINGHWSRRPRR